MTPRSTTIPGLAAMAAGLALIGCSPSGAAPETGGNYKQSVETPSPGAREVADRDPQALEIGTIHEPATDADCTFIQTGHTLVADDPETWKFVFLNEATATTPEARIRINDDILNFEEADLATDDTGIETWHYRSTDRAILVELKLRETASDEDQKTYTGTIAITEPVQTQKMGIEGSCGV